MARLEDYLMAAEATEGSNQKRPIGKHKRSGEELTREQIRAIKKGRKLLRKEMRAKGIKDKSSFELTASNLSLYFDKPRWLLWLRWFWFGKGLWAALAAAGLMVAALFFFSTVTQLQGHFTINMSDGLFREGFVLSPTKGFENPMTNLFCTPAENVPCVSISHLPDTLDTIDGAHNASYFAYTFYCRNEGESTVDYEWQLNLNSESNNLPAACWVMIFEDGEMTFYARRNVETGLEEALPAFDDDSRGYIGKPLGQFAKYPDKQYQTIEEGNGYTYERVIPIPFVTNTVVAQGIQEEVAPMEVHKYTVVIWLEGDDPDCNDELIGGHLGMDFHFQMVDDEDESGLGTGDFNAHWDDLWSNLKFWNK